MNRGRGSTRRWRKFRERVLSEEPLCRWCAAKGYTVAAVHVHHVAEVREAPEREFDRSNCVSLCEPCHTAHHATVPEPPAGQSGFDARVAELEAMN